MLDAEAVVFAVPSDTNGPRLEKIPGRVPTSGTTDESERSHTENAEAAHIAV
jgi:hypothetical protein